MLQYKYTSLRLIPFFLERLAEVSRKHNIPQVTIVECFLNCSDEELDRIISENIDDVKALKAETKAIIGEKNKIETAKSVLSKLSPEEIAQVISSIPKA